MTPSTKIATKFVEMQCFAVYQILSWKFLQIHKIVNNLWTFCDWRGAKWCHSDRSRQEFSSCQQVFGGENRLRYRREKVPQGLDHYISYITCRTSCRCTSVQPSGAARKTSAFCTQLLRQHLHPIVQLAITTTTLFCSSFMWHPLAATRAQSSELHIHLSSNLVAGLGKLRQYIL